LPGTLFFTTLLFVSIHVGQGDYLYLTMIAVFSVILGMSREKTNSLWIPIILHATNNFLAVLAAIV
jgi:membrane protease YdiL (CAAX protease family)